MREQSQMAVDGHVLTQTGRAAQMDTDSCGPPRPADTPPKDGDFFHAWTAPNGFGQTRIYTDECAKNV